MGGDDADCFEPGRIYYAIMKTDHINELRQRMQAQTRRDFMATAAEVAGEDSPAVRSASKSHIRLSSDLGVIAA